MKNLFTLLLFASFATVANAQLAPDQNPNYKISQDKYMEAKDSLMANMNTTVQSTYKAYDFYQAKVERKQQRISDRRERRMARAMDYNRFNHYNPYNRNYFNPYNSYYNPYRNWNGYRPGIGYNWNNWFFGW